MVSNLLKIAEITEPGVMLRYLRIPLIILESTEDNVLLRAFMR